MSVRMRFALVCAGVFFLLSVMAVTVVYFVDVRLIDQIDIDETAEQLYSLVDEQGHTRLLLNFGTVQFMASAFLGKLNHLKRKVTAVKGRIKLCSIHPELIVVFKMIGFDRVFEIFDTEQAALDSPW